MSDWLSSHNITISLLSALPSLLQGRPHCYTAHLKMVKLFYIMGILPQFNFF